MNLYCFNQFLVERKIVTFSAFSGKCTDPELLKSFCRILAKLGVQFFQDWFKGKTTFTIAG